ncbi:glycosyltransferase family 2 protein [Clostridium perfringens]|uniref:glycosyltransferase family 2 protein n=3 Tax=Clostridium perfringens TaxID=1502 RepID=UPI000E1B4C97|nr:glycosyltransferase family 2 protein [Clostridium perfringens]EJT6493238.1 glycosyltransferase [Clostridium perfringens]MDH5064248.1 glycosyl transferase [Clostridium perfringens]MDK0592105.1 glycosyltransferase family 2 protein [Clostridium perfringens]MDK0595130.1 glycosyltransferase family 2 protein [Clostridium perfringens]MDU2748966.1 glycosyltransferase family 2 protein [Clostridium perfringens]
MNRNKMISVIIATYNCEDCLEETLKSLFLQNCNNFEVIFVDGNSKDKTLEIIKKYKNLFNKKEIDVKVISENDNGIYDAMNKGIKISSGEYLYFLNAKDIIKNNDIFIKIINILKNYDVDILYGNVETEILIKQDKKLKNQIIFKGICHQSAFIKKNLFDEIGIYNTKYKVSADYDFFTKAYFLKKNFKYINLTIIEYDMSGYSSQKNNIKVGIREYKKIIDSNLNGINKILGNLRYLYLNLKFLLNKF